MLGFEYILRSAEVAKSKDASKVIEVRQAAVALACASSSVQHSVIAKREASRLFSEGPVYSALFNPQTDPLRLSRAVQITREVDLILDELERDRDGVEAGIATHGRRVIAHLVMKELGDEFLRDPESGLESALTALNAQVSRLVAALVAVFPANAYPGNVFKNYGQVRELIGTAGL